MNYDKILSLLSQNNFKREVISSGLLFKGDFQRALFKLAQKKLKEYFPPNFVEVRSVIEISNICQRKCNFCNINYYSKKIGYLLTATQLLRIVEAIYYKGRKVILLQSGENHSQKYIDLVCNSIENIKKKFKDLTIILCLGSLNYTQYKQLKSAGADRYILKFETSNPKLYKQIKPDDSLKSRIECLHMLIDLGFEVGTGNIIGLPHQTLKDIVDDLFFLSKFKLKMASTSVFIPGEYSNYRNYPKGDIDLALNYTALMRIMYPHLLIPSTSSLENAKKGSQYMGLVAGANAITVHDGTPDRLKRHYPIYSIRRFIPKERHISNIIKEMHT